MSLAAGIDLVEVARIARGMERHGKRFARRFFTAQEIEYCQERPERLAARFALKEAVGKAMGTGIGDVSWQEIEVICDGRGKPELVLHGRARDLAGRLGLHNWAISLSHTDTHAVGMAVATGMDLDQ